MTNVHAQVVRTENLFVKQTNIGQEISDLQKKVDNLTDIVNWMADTLEKTGTDVPKDQVNS